MPMRSIWWVSGQGQAAYGEVVVQLPGAPQLLPGVAIIELQFIPRVLSEWVSYEGADGNIFTRRLMPEECQRLNDALRKMSAEGLRALGFE